MSKKIDTVKIFLTYKSSLSILLMLFTAFSSAQNGHIKGIINNGNEHIPDATVWLGNKTVLSDHKGEFSFSVRPGIYTLFITHTGYKKIEQEVKIDSGHTQVVDFNMTAVEQMGEVVVLGSRATVQRSNLNTPVPVDVFSNKQLL